MSLLVLFNSIVKVVKVGLCLFFFLSYFYFIFDLFSIFGKKGQGLV